MKGIIRIVAADDHRLFLEGLKSLFQLMTEFELLEVAENGDHLLALITEYSPHIVLLDLSMPGASTKKILQTLDVLGSSTKVIALTMHLEAQFAQDYFEMGLRGYVLKDAAFDELRDAIITVMQGDKYISPSMQEALRLVSVQKKNTGVVLTRRELDVLNLASEGKTNKEIGRGLGISERTVRFHISNCCVKLNAQGRSHAVAKALQSSLIVLESIN